MSERKLAISYRFDYSQLVFKSALRELKHKYRPQLLPAYYLYRGVAVCPSRRTARQKQLYLDGAHITVEQRRLVMQMSSRISPRDEMYAGDFGRYVNVGLSAIDCINEALESAGSPTIVKILDLPCGHGRVLRLLKPRFPEAVITACEIDRDCVEFCQEEFGAIPAYSRADIENLDLGTKFDLVWSGSLVTHFTEGDSRRLLEFFGRHLAPGGLMVFSAHGEFVTELFENGNGPLYGVSEDHVPIMLREQAETGFGFAPYADSESYGVSLTTREWVERQVGEMPGLELTYFAPRKWDNHQDVYGVRRTSG